MRVGNLEVRPLGGGLGCLFMVLFSLVASVVLMVLVLVNLLLRWHLLSWFAFSAAARPDARLFTRQQRIVHGVLARAVLAAQVGCVVQPVWSCRAGCAVVE